MRGPSEHDSKNAKEPDASSISALERRRILFVVLVAMFMTLIDVSIVNVAIPSIQASLNASNDHIQWILSGYTLTFGVVLVAAGRAGDLFGRGGLFILGMALFTASSVVAGLAPDADWLNGARFVQGVGSGILGPQTVGMIQQYFQGEARGRAFGYLGTTVGFSVAIGPVLGGLLIQFGGLDLGWRLTFLVNLPIGIAAILLSVLWFPKPLFKRGLSATANNESSDGGGMRALDPVGTVLLGLAVLAFLFPFVESGGSPHVWTLLAVSALLGFLWVRWERRCARLGRQPMVDLSIFSTPSFSNGTIIVTLYFLGITSVWILLALYVQTGNGMTALQSGSMGVPAALLSAYSANWAGKRVTRYGRIIVVGGIILSIAGLGLTIVVILLHDSGHISVWWLLATLGVLGLGQGSVISPNQTLTLNDVPLEYAGSSGAIVQTGQRIGTSVGIAIITAVVFATLAASSSWATAAVVGYGAIALVMCVALAWAIEDLRDRKGAPPARVPNRRV